MRIKDEVHSNLSEILTSEKPGADNFKQAVNSFIRYHNLKQTRKTTTDWYKTHLNSFYRYLNEFEITTKPKEISREIIEEYILYCKESLGNTTETVNGKIRTIKAFFNYLVEENILLKNPTKKIKQMKTREKIIPTFTAEQIKLLLSQPDIRKFSGLRDYVVILMLLDTGARINELLSTKINHIEYQDNLPECLIIKETKNFRERKIYLSLKTSKSLKKYKK